MKTTSILLVPDPNDRYGLLREGLCGARPPMAGLSMDQWIPDPREYPYECSTMALVLQWQGRLVFEGWSRIQRKLDTEYQSISKYFKFPNLLTLTNPEETACDIASLFSCRLVLLDAGRERTEL